MKRKLPAFLLALVMAVSTLSTAALAAGSPRYQVLLKPSLQLTTMDNEWESISGGIKYACGDVIVTELYDHGNSIMGLMNTKGEVLVEYGVYDSINEFEYGYSYVEKGGEFGIIDMSGKEIIPLGRYDLIWPVGENRFRAVVGDEVGIIDADGNFIVPLGKYGSLINFPESPSVLWAETDEGTFLVDLDGNKISETFKDIQRADYQRNFPVQFQDGTYGMVDSHGNTLVNSGKYKVYSSLGNYYIVENASGQRGIINTQGDFMVNFGVYNLGFVRQGRAVLYDDDSYALMNENLEEVFPLGQYTYSADVFHDGLACVYPLDDEALIHPITIDVNGNVLDYLDRYKNETYDVAEIYTTLREGSGYFLIQLMNSNVGGACYGVIDVFGNEIVAPGQFDNFFLSDTNVLWVGKSGVWGAYQLPEVDWEGFVNGTAVNPNQSETPAESETAVFSDVEAGDWYFEAAEYVSSNGLMSGTGNGKFSPNSTTTRGMLTTILARMNGVDTSGGTVWYDKGTVWAKEQGISDGTNPTGSITREQLAAMLYRYMDSPAAGSSLDGFSDSDKVSSYAEDAMCWAVKNGLISGMGGGTLNPQGNATRAQVATILMRFCSSLAE